MDILEQERAPAARPFQLVLTRPAESWAWMRGDLVLRLGPFAAAVAVAWLLWRPRWLGLGPGDLRAQLLFGLIGLPAFFLGAVALQAAVSRRRGALRVPAGPADAALQAAYYVLNGPLEEAFFRGLLQGGLAVVVGPPAGFALATAAYVLYHRLGAWTWTDVLVTVLGGVPLGMAFWLLPGPPSLVGVAIAHVGATCGYLGPGPYLLRRLRLLPS
jgi:membrane protease YdiL (CAAX protease family)